MSNLIFNPLHLYKIFILGGMRKVIISFQIDERIKTALQKLAEDETRSLSNYVMTIFMKHLENHGIDWRKEKPKK
jgi:hypothetical protein